jgi:hypothetical protein
MDPAEQNGKCQYRWKHSTLWIGYIRNNLVKRLFGVETMVHHNVENKTGSLSKTTQK